MKLKFANQILTNIAALYPGGADQFVQDGGLIFVAPDPCRDIVVCHPNFPEDLLHSLIAIRDENIGVPGPHIVLRDKVNFGGDLDALYAFMDRIIDRLDNIADNTVIVATFSAVALKDEGMSEDTANEIRDWLKSQDGLEMAYVCYKDGFHRIEPEPFQDPPPRIETQAPTRDVITKDDTLNLKIDLENISDVNEFLERM